MLGTLWYSWIMKNAQQAAYINLRKEEAERAQRLHSLETAIAKRAEEIAVKYPVIHFGNKELR